MRGEAQTWALGIAWAVSEASEDPHCRVGAVLLSSDRIVIATGYNGPPSKVAVDWTDRDARRPYMIHAEANALRYATPAQSSGGMLAVTHQPCASCVNLASAYGLATIVYGSAPADPERYPLGPALEVARTAGITLLMRGTRR